MRKLLAVGCILLFAVTWASAAPPKLRMGAYEGDLNIDPPPLPPPPHFAIAGPVNVEPPYRWMVQFEHPLTRDERRQLQDPPHNLALDDYLGSGVYLEKTTEATLLDLPPGLLYAYEPFVSFKLKLPRDLFDMSEGGRGNNRPIRLRATLFDDADLDDTVNAIKLLGAAAAEGLNSEGRLTITFTMAPIFVDGTSRAVL